MGFGGLALAKGGISARKSYLTTFFMSHLYRSYAQVSWGYAFLISCWTLIPSISVHTEVGFLTSLCSFCAIFLSYILRFMRDAYHYCFFVFNFMSFPDYFLVCRARSLGLGLLLPLHFSVFVCPIHSSPGCRYLIDFEVEFA